MELADLLKSDAEVLELRGDAKDALIATLFKNPARARLMASRIAVATGFRNEDGTRRWTMTEGDAPFPDADTIALPAPPQSLMPEADRAKLGVAEAPEPARVGNWTDATGVRPTEG